MHRYAQWLLRYRLIVIFATLAITAGLGYFAAGLKIVIDPDTLAPQGHPYIESSRRVDKLFGSKYLMIIGVTPKQGDVYQPDVLRRIERLTRKLETTPGVVRSSIMSISARQAKGIKGTTEGFEARPLLRPGEDLTEAELNDLKAAIAANPVYDQTVISRDRRTAAILFELKENPGGFHQMVAPVTKVVDAERSDSVTISLGGNPVYLDRTETFAERIGILFPIAVVVIGLLHFEAFRSWQGLVLPLVTALVAVVWGTGFMGVLGQSLDVFNSPTPILILAVAAGHAVQLLKRYYEEYDAVRREGVNDLRAANEQAVIRSLIGVGPVMIVAGGVAAAGFFSLLTFSIPTIRAFGVFTGIGVVSAVIIEMTLIPAVRSLLKPPPDAVAEVDSPRVWDRIPRWLADQVVPTRPRMRLLGVMAISLALLSWGMSRIVVDNSTRNYFSSSLDIQKDDGFLNTQLGGTTSLYIMVEGLGGDDSIKDPALLAAMDDTQRLMAGMPQVGKTISIVDYLKRMNRAMNADSVSSNVLPASRDLISQYLFLYSMSGDSGDFDAYVDYGYKAAKITVLLKTSSNSDIKAIVQRLEEFTRDRFAGRARVTFGGDAIQAIALTDTMVKGKLMNIVQIGLAVFLISSLVFRSSLAGLIVLTPLLVAVVAVFGVMGLAGIPLNIPNSLISAMAVGIGADYAIYFLYRLREFAANESDPGRAVRKALATAGKASMFVATAVAGGYGVLSFSLGYNVHQWLSLFIVVAMVVSLVASLTLAPIFALWLRPAFVFRPSQRQSGWQMATMLVIGAGVLMMASKYAHAAPTPADLMERSVEAVRFKDSTLGATFTLTNKDGVARVRKTMGYTRLRANGVDNMRLVRFLAPADIKGTATLTIENSGADDDLWVYLPAMKKVRRLSAANKRDSFVGTDLSYGDVIGHRTSDWNHKLLREEVQGGVPCYVVESTPVSDGVKQNSGYAKRLTFIAKSNFVAIRTEAWDEAGQPLKRMVVSDLRQAGKDGRWYPGLSQIENLQTGHKTTIHVDSFKTDESLSEGMFKAQELEQ